MIGSGIKKFAQANGMTVKGGVAYGAYRGIHITMAEGAGWKSVSVAAYLEGAEQTERILGWLNDPARKKEYRIQGCAVTDPSVHPGAVQIAFLDNPGTMKKIEAFLPQLADLLVAQGVKSVGVCHACGMPDSGAADIKLGQNVYRLHETCASHVEAELADEAEEKKTTGSVASGILGAGLGALIGLIPWVIVYALGYMASVLGLLIGVCAKKGYDLAHGKQTKAKGIVILICVVLAVIVAELVGIVALTYVEGLEYGMSLTEVVVLVFDWILREGMLDVIKETAVGLFFALLGVGQLLIETFRETKTAKISRL